MCLSAAAPTCSSSAARLCAAQGPMLIEVPGVGTNFGQRQVGVCGLLSSRCRTGSGLAALQSVPTGHQPRFYQVRRRYYREFTSVKGSEVWGGAGRRAVCAHSNSPGDQLAAKWGGFTLTLSSGFHAPGVRTAAARHCNTVLAQTHHLEPRSLSNIECTIREIGGAPTGALNSSIFWPARQSAARRS